MAELTMLDVSVPSTDRPVFRARDRKPNADGLK